MNLLAHHISHTHLLTAFVAARRDLGTPRYGCQCRSSVCGWMERKHIHQTEIKRQTHRGREKNKHIRERQREGGKERVEKRRQEGRELHSQGCRNSGYIACLTRSQLLHIR